MKILDIIYSLWLLLFISIRKTRLSYGKKYTSANHDGLTMLLSDLQHCGFKAVKLKKYCDYLMYSYCT